MSRKYFIACVPALVFLCGFKGDGRVCVSSSEVENRTNTGGFDFSTSLEVTRLTEEPSATDSILRLWLSPQIVNNDKPVASTFYFWISPEELDSVLGQKQLLRTSAPSSNLDQIYWDRLLGTVDDAEPISIHLRSGQRQRIRITWPNYWSQLTEASVLSQENQLIQVELLDSALIVEFSPDENKKNRWAVYDLQGKAVSMERALQRLDYIAAVFISGRNRMSYPGPRVYVHKECYRTFVLCNEKMIKSWHHAVPGMQDKIIQDLDYLLLLNGYFREGWMFPSQGKKGKIALASWTMTESEMKMNNYFFATQRLAWMGGVDADSAATKKIIDLLRMRWPVQKNVCERYPGRYPVYNPRTGEK